MLQGTQSHNQSQVFPPEDRSATFPVYDESVSLTTERIRMKTDNANSSTVPTSDFNINSCDRYSESQRRLIEEKKAPAVVPLPAFQQAFGSTEIGRFAEAFSRAEVVVDDASSEPFPFEGFSDWDGQTEPLWSSQPVTKEIKCEENL